MIWRGMERRWYGEGEKMVWTGREDDMERERRWYGEGEKMVWRGREDGLEKEKRWFGEGEKMVWRRRKDGMERERVSMPILICETKKHEVSNTLSSCLPLGLS